MPEGTQDANTSGTQAASTGTTGTSGAPATGTPVAAATGTTASPTGTPGTTGTPTDTRPAATTQEDRSNWIPPHRLREETGKRTAIEQERDTLRRQLQALTGATPPDAGQVKNDAVKADFIKLFPHLEKFVNATPAQIERMLAAPDHVEQANSFVSQQWKKHGQTMLSDLTAEVSAEIGGELSARAQTRLKGAFADFIEQETAKSRQAGQPTALLQRYLDGDKKLVQEFAKEWSDDFITPARRQVTSREVNRGRAVPNSNGRSQQTAVVKPAAFKNWDERLDYAVGVAKERGMQFSR
jgi:hypothetical protein